jgi:hypothetical protein
VKKYKAHNTYQQTQAVANQYKSAAYAGPPPNEEAVGNDDATYISALEETVARLATERETAYAAANAATAKAAAMSPGNTLAANTLNGFQNQLLVTEMRNEMKKVLVAATTSAATSSSARGGDTAKDGGKERWRKTSSDLPLCPHCKRNGKHKPEDCFSLPANADKKPANFIGGRYVNGKKKEWHKPGQNSDSTDNH